MQEATRWIVEDAEEREIFSEMKYRTTISPRNAVPTMSRVL